jgi:nitroreductase/dihydropteridine reductase
MNHPVIEDLQWRHTAKRYDPTKRIPTQDLDTFFEALRLSPSSINSQPWRFVVVDSEDARKRLDKTFGDKYPFNRPHVFEASQIILLAHNPRYNRDDYSRIIDKEILDGRIKMDERDKAFAKFIFAEMNTDEAGNTAAWTKAQLYIALGNALHTLARLKIDATPLEGIDTPAVNDEFKQELNGYRCDVALAIGYHHPEKDFNAELPKSRRKLEDILIKI